MKQLVICAILLLPGFTHAENGEVQSCKNAHQNTILETSELIPTKTTVVAALGRIADLGDLYDAKSDNFVDISLYNSNLSGDAIHSTDNTHTYMDYVRTESISEKMKKFKVEASLSVSVLSGLIKLVSGSGKYLIQDKKSAKSAKTSLIYSSSTVREHLKIFSNSSKNLIDKFLLENIDATHVVVGIDWGANVVLSLEETNTDSSNVKEIQGKLEAALRLAVFSISGSSDVNFNNSFDVENSNTFRLYLNGDIIPNTVPQTINETIGFIRDIPNLIKKKNGGKGKILNYTLMPLRTVQRVLQVQSKQTNTVQEIDQELTDQFMRIFQEMKNTELQINDAYNLFNTWNLLIPENEFEKIKEMKSEFDLFMTNLRIRFADLLMQFRSGQIEDKVLCQWISSYENSSYTPNNVDNLLDTYTQTIHKIDLLNLFQSYNALFIDRETDQYEILIDNYEQEIRIISVDLNINISSPYVRKIIELLKMESKKGTGALKYYIEDVPIKIPEVKSYIEGNVKDVFAVDKKEYLLITDKSGKVIIIDINSYEIIKNYSMPELGEGSSIAVVNKTFYNIYGRKGRIFSADIENMITTQNGVNWTQAGSFPPSEYRARNGAVANGLSIYFVSDYTLYVYDTIYRTVTKSSSFSNRDEYYSMVVVNNILYTQINSSFYSFDGAIMKKIKTFETREHSGLFQYDNSVCRVGGNTTNVYPNPVSCYYPEDGGWTDNGYINEARRYPGVAATSSGTYIFGGYVWNGNWINSVEVLNHKTKVWSYIPSKLISGQEYPQAVAFYF